VKGGRQVRRITEDPENELVIIDEFKLDGWIENANCDCGAPLVYFERYDAQFCPECNEWRQSRCGDRNCYYCPGRPERPLPPVSK
jgi:hypothetical protein